MALTTGDAEARQADIFQLKPPWHTVPATLGGVMKLAWLFGLVAPLLLAACASTAQFGRQADVAKLSGVVVSDGWQPGERIVPGTSMGKYSTGPKREGKSPAGYNYDIFGDGSGGIDVPGPSVASGWSIGCTKDKITDKRNCEITSHDARLLIWYGTSTSPTSVCIIGHDFPGRTGAIRVDGQGAVTTDREGCASGSVVGALSKGTKVVVRYVEWPYDYSRDNEASLAGLSDAIALMTFIRGNIDRLPF